ncbi:MULTISPECIES: transcriptional regulator [unclassified Nocardia]|uniref:transcriptional regulator n=1 Tax=unclassified Nocardia TaxID=2637762 RepID=UPI00278C2829|nr:MULTISPECIES: transcriptional regulator [unclassified Nocardia]
MSANHPDPDTARRHRHPDELALYHANPRRGHLPAITESLIMNGQYRPIVTNLGTHTGRPLEVLAGNHTLLAIRELATATADDPRWTHLARQPFPPGDPCWQRVLVHEIDVDDETARRIVAVDNRTGELGSYDDELLLDILRELDDLAGTGYDDVALAALEDIVAGAPDLDDLADELGPDEPDDHATLSLKQIDPHTRRLWEEHRKAFSDDDTALLRLLDDELRGDGA